MNATIPAAEIAKPMDGLAREPEVCYCDRPPYWHSVPWHHHFAWCAKCERTKFHGERCRCPA